MAFIKKFPSVLSRLRAMGIHLIISGIIFAIIAFLFIYIYFPSIHFYINGGWQGLGLIFIIDLILGPILTFLIYNSQKSLREKILDLSIVAIVQLSALVYGFYTIYQDHPVLLVAYPGAVIDTISKYEYDRDLPKANLADFQTMTGLPIVAYDPTKKTKNFGLVSVDSQKDNIIRVQSTIIKQLNENEKDKLEQHKLRHSNVYILMLIGSFKTEWIMVDENYTYLGSLKREATTKLPNIPAKLK